MRPARRPDRGVLAAPAAVVALLVLCVLLLAACGSEPAPSPSPTVSAAAYAGLWQSTDGPSGDVWWIRATAGGDKVHLEWDRLWTPAVTQEATLQADGSLTAPAVAADFQANTDAVPAYTGRLTADGGLELSTTTQVTGVDAKIPVTLSFRRGSQAEFARFVARRDKNVAEQRASDAFGAMLWTIGGGVSDWIGDHDGTPPPVAEVRPGGEIGKLLEAKGIAWPLLENGKLLLPGTGPGTYRYQPRPAAHGYKIRGTALNGQEQTITQTG